MVRRKAGSSQWSTVGMDDERARIALDRGSRVFLVAGGVAVGVVLALVLRPVSGWLGDQSWLPWSGVVDAIERFARWAPLAARLPAGVALGAAAGLLLVGEATVVEVSRRDVVVIKGRTRTRWARAQVGEAILDGRRLSLRDPQDADLAAETIDGDPAALRSALVRYGWPVR